MSSQNTLQVVTGDGVFNSENVKAFMRDHHLEAAGVDYSVVAITGPQSSGKSTLMNTLFATSFEEMDAFSGRNQTTKGIWLAKSSKVASPTTLVMDLEGSDGRERGEDDTSFERQSSLFALAVADVLLVNMWAKDVGREAGSGKPLLKTIFQVNLKLFTPAPNKRKTVLLFVFRDRTKTPMERLKETWETDLGRMWSSITKPEQYEGLSLADFFEVKYSSLPNYEDREEEFKAEAVLLRRRFTHEGDDSLIRISEDKLPGDSLALSMGKVWEVIKDQKDLNLPAHKVMVANIRCTEIMEDQLQSFTQDQAWQSLKTAAGKGVVPGFGRLANDLVESCITGYDDEARYFEASVRQAKRAELLQEVHSTVGSAFHQQLRHLHAAGVQTFQTGMQAALQADPAGFSNAVQELRSQALASFSEGLRDVNVPGTNWDTAEPSNAFEEAVDAWTEQLRQQQITQVMQQAEKRLEERLAGPAMALLDGAAENMWPRLQHLLASCSGEASKGAAEGLAGYGITPAEAKSLNARLRAAGRGKLQSLVSEVSHTALSRMKDRFAEVFNKDEHDMPRTWGTRANIPAAAQQARQAALQVLALLAVTRLAPGKDGQDAVHAAILALADDKMQRRASESLSTDRATFDMYSASEWPADSLGASNGVSEGPDQEVVMITPPSCRMIWRQFQSDTGYIVQQARATQDANRAASNKMPPLWALAAIVVLGFNEVMSVLRSPLLLISIILGLLFAKTVYEELDVDAAMQNGLLPGALSLAGNFWPAIKAVARRTALTLKSLFEDPSHIQSFVPEQLQHQLHVGSRRQVEMTGLRRVKGDKSAVKSKGPVNGLRSRDTAEIAEDATAHSVPGLDSRKDQ